jgi:hypothetical protein
MGRASSIASLLWESQSGILWGIVWDGGLMVGIEAVLLPVFLLERELCYRHCNGGVKSSKCLNVLYNMNAPREMRSLDYVQRDGQANCALHN